ncbi:CRISPR system precrRNA processing endoribonuclease RAMP protein Cas6 [Niveispirillum sp.]|uniref:CRISPR system precrRNA processing endoribonuclease RAMP protein Cas6 n=1 Tax=Niveispirillum sp. TaxID=1917217 RepID=UPI001B4BE0A9|nr:CRISPR system precrRNA processing endoribonuclease RAMP protein Cas6 [Niveispirillum sp.]MBP7339264.1 CRISPR system precrRNA processing endoribonuclease RAMP protein Cas6 [Niveispirillum sp.]
MQVMDGVMDSVAVRLATPAHRLSLRDLCGRWFMGTGLFAVALPGAMAADPALPGKLRGGWGRQLLAGASAPAAAGRPCPWDPPCAYDVLFRERPLLKGMEMPKPFLFAAEAGGTDITHLRLTLFGFASDLLDLAADALVRALATGLDLPGGRRGVAVAHRRLTGDDHLPLPPVPHAVTLRFHTPLCLRRGGVTLTGTELLPALVTSLGNRISALARWQDSELVADWPGLRNHAATLLVDVTGLHPTQWQRGSARQDHGPLPMGGLIGDLRLSGDLTPLWPLFCLGETCHTGSHTAQGLGRYSLVPGGG